MSLPTGNDVEGDKEKEEMYFKKKLKEVRNDNTNP
jgi:hypothetical protein